MLVVRSRLGSIFAANEDPDQRGWRKVWSQAGSEKSLELRCASPLAVEYIDAELAAEALLRRL